MIKTTLNLAKTLRLTHGNRFTFIEPSCYNIKAKINPVINVTLSNQTADVCNLQFRLFENVVPRTSENFKRLLLGEGRYDGRVLSLINNAVHGYIRGAYIEMGHLDDGNCSIFGPNFRDESFQMLHDRPGLLSSISEENTNNSRFAITLAPCPFMDYKNTVFGEVTAQSMQDLKNIQRLGSNNIMKLRISKTEEIPRQLKYEEGAHLHQYQMSHH